MDICEALTLRLGSREVNVHFVKNGEVHFGQYDDMAEQFPLNCVGLYRLPVDQFRKQMESALSRGAVPFTRIEWRG